MKGLGGGFGALGKKIGLNSKDKKLMDMSYAAGLVDQCDPKDRFGVCSCNRSGEGDGQIFKVGCKTAPGMPEDTPEEKLQKMNGDPTAKMDAQKKGGPPMVECNMGFYRNDDINSVGCMVEYFEMKEDPHSDFGEKTLKKVEKVWEVSNTETEQCLKVCPQL